MADGINLLRRAYGRQSGRAVGLPTNQPTQTISNQQTRGHQGSILAQPVDVEKWHPLQVTDTASSDFGKFYFLPSYDVPGDTSKVVR